MLIGRRLPSPLRMLFVIAVFVRPIPIGKDDDSWRQSLALSPLFGIADFKVDVVSVLELFVEVALEPIGPSSIVLDDLLEVVEEFAVRVHAGDFDVGTGMLNEITLKEWNGLYLC